MFREMRRIRQQQSHEICEKVLKQEKRGVLAVHGEDGYPYAFPMDYVYKNGVVYFHSAKEGHKIDALRADARASFCVHDQGYQKEDDWAYFITSVVIFGRIRFVEDRKEAYAAARELGIKYYPDAAGVDEEMEKAFDRVQMLALEIDHITGKLVHEK